jgi:hypothetical protein
MTRHASLSLVTKVRPAGSRLRYEIHAGGRRLAAQEALRVFRLRTGRDLTADAHLHFLLAQVASGLDAEARGDRRDFIDAPGSADDVRPIELAARRGHPNLSPRLIRAIGDLVAEVGSANAALAMLLGGHDASKAFPVSKAPSPGHPWDAAVLVRRLQKRLSDIARSGRERLPNTSVRVFGQYR